MALKEPVPLELVRHYSNARRIGLSVQSETKQRKKQVLVGICGVGFLDDSPGVAELREAAKEVIVFGQVLYTLD